MALMKRVGKWWRLVAVCAFAGVLTLGAWRVPAEETQPSVAGDPVPQAEAQLPGLPEKPADPAEPIDVTDQVEITVHGGLRSTSRTTHAASVTVKSIAEEDLPGRLVLVVDQTGVEGLDVSGADGDVDGGKKYVELVSAKGKLEPGRLLRAKKIEFSTVDPLTATQRQAFDLALRVLRLPEDQPEADDEKIPGKKYSEADVQRVMVAQRGLMQRVMEELGNDKVYGSSIGEDDNGNLVIRVHTVRHGVARDLPADADGVALKPVVIGRPFRPGPGISGVTYIDGKPRVRRDRMVAGGGGGGKLQPVPDPAPEPVPEPVPEPPGDGGSEATAPAPGAPGEQDPNCKDCASVTNPTPDDGSPQAGPPFDPTIRFPRPIPIGVSAFNTGGFFAVCATGTIGARTLDPIGGEFAISNNHVMAGSSGPYWDFINNVWQIVAIIQDANIGDPIQQPGPLDAVPICNINPADTVAFLADYEPIKLVQQGRCNPNLPRELVNYIDAAVVQALPGQVGFDTPDDGYGAPQRVAASPQIGMAVQKYGRTTQYTRGNVIGINTMTCVGPYNVFGTTLLFGWFEDQIEIVHEDVFNFSVAFPLRDFSGPGDSGSIIVAHDPGGINDRRPIGLLYAGGGGLTIANRIQRVYNRFQLMVDDGSGRRSSSGESGSMGNAIGPVPPLP